MSTGATVTCEARGAIQILTLSNPSKRNALTSAMSAALLRLLDAAESDPAVRCVIITGAGDDAFSSGHDLTEQDWQKPPAAGEDPNAAFVRPAQLSKPTIAAVNGPAYAAGFVLALNCDLRTASDNASFCASGARMGLLPVSGQISRLPALLPHGKALELLITGQPMRAAEAHALGFVSSLAGKGESLKQALALAEAIAGNSPTVVREIKRGLELRMREGIEQARAFEQHVGARLKGGPDHLEGVRAFQEKRAPVFPPPRSDDRT